ncbi:DJ-1/PfpI family protein [Roseococcus thiosulfatophilus]|uniref:DJ-1/PfpI family protein n=1 Tax=Roseococcus thiosulfatophilus TaxID=35813 RepID=UPI001A8F8DFB|nr:DJ-1/PfpI family protein [Roseococcus thiosulfatophilus]
MGMPPGGKRLGGLGKNSGASGNRRRWEWRNAGALVEDAEVVVDGNLITSRMPADIPAFTRALMDALSA